MPDARSQTYLRTETMLKTAMGPAVVEALDDPAIVEVMVNPDGKIWIDAHGDGRMETGTIMPAAEAERVIRVVGSHIGGSVVLQHRIVELDTAIKPMHTGRYFRSILDITFKKADYLLIHRHHAFIQDVSGFRPKCLCCLLIN